MLTSRHDKIISCTNSQELWLCAQGMHKIKLGNIAPWVREELYHYHKRYWHLVAAEGGRILLLTAK